MKQFLGEDIRIESTIDVLVVGRNEAMYNECPYESLNIKSKESVPLAYNPTARKELRGSTGQ